MRNLLQNFFPELTEIIRDIQFANLYDRIASAIACIIISDWLIIMSPDWMSKGILFEFVCPFVCAKTLTLPVTLDQYESQNVYNYFVCVFLGPSSLRSPWYWPPWLCVTLLEARYITNIFLFQILESLYRRWWKT